MRLGVEITAHNSSTDIECGSSVSILRVSVSGREGSEPSYLYWVAVKELKFKLP